MALHEGVLVGEVRGDPVAVPADGRGDDGEAPLVRSTPLQLRQDRAQFTVGGEPACPRGEFTHALRIRERIEGVQKSFHHGAIVPSGNEVPRTSR
ncbi:hypothetical protein ACWD62_12545 [Streptomyces sp. NPDC005146]